MPLTLSPLLTRVLVLTTLLAIAPAGARYGPDDGEPVRPLPSALPVDARKAALGERLFHDARLSGDGRVACASCHVLDQGGDDGRARPVGIGGAHGRVNTPTVFNAAFNFRQLWDGRAGSLEEQVDLPLHSPTEMGSNWPTVLARVAAVPAYREAFAQLYGGAPAPEHVRHAIAEFERTLITPNAPFDRFLRGETAALSAAAQAGYRKFKRYGCASCHQGTNLGGNMYQRMGLFGDYFADRGGLGTADYGRFNVTDNEADRYRFKVPGLRNVALTAPYLHDGAVATLEEAVRVMARYQLGRELPPQDVDELVQFLRSLTGEYRRPRP